MSVIIQITKTVYDSNKKKILKFTLGTLLDKILDDLWNDIVKYLDYHLYIFGTYGESYPGYHQMTQIEFRIQRDKFKKYYFEKGLVNKIIDSNWSSDFVIDGYGVCIGCGFCYIVKNKICYGRDINSFQKNNLLELSGKLDYSNGSKKATIMVKNQ